MDPEENKSNECFINGRMTLPSSPNPKSKRTRRNETAAADAGAPLSKARTSVGHQTQTDILNVAEEICAREGFEGLSIRAIADTAGVNLAAINYYFGSKQQLFEAMFRRRVVPLNEERLTLLAQCGTENQPAYLENVIRAFVTPPMKLTDFADPDGRSALVVMQFLARVFAMPGEGPFLTEYYEPVRSLFVQALQQARPTLALEEILWRYNLMVGAIIYAMAGTARMTRPPQAFAGSLIHKAPTADEAIEEMVRFFAAGMRAPSRS